MRKKYFTNFEPIKVRYLEYNYKHCENKFGIKFKETNDIIVTADAYCSIIKGNRGVLMTNEIDLYNGFISPNQWFEIDGFATAFKEFETRYGEASKGRKVIKKFKSKLSDENKLILEVI